MFTQRVSEGLMWERLCWTKEDSVAPPPPCHKRPAWGGGDYFVAVTGRKISGADMHRAFCTSQSPADSRLRWHRDLQSYKGSAASAHNAPHAHKKTNANKHLGVFAVTSKHYSPGKIWDNFQVEVILVFSYFFSFFTMHTLSSCFHAHTAISSLAHW